METLAHQDQLVVLDSQVPRDTGDSLGHREPKESKEDRVKEALKVLQDQQVHQVFRDQEDPQEKGDQTESKDQLVNVVLTETQDLLDRQDLLDLPVFQVSQDLLVQRVSMEPTD